MTPEIRETLNHAWAELIIGPESTQSVPILQDYLTDIGFPAMEKRVTHSSCPLRQRI